MKVNKDFSRKECSFLPLMFESATSDIEDVGCLNNRGAFGGSILVWVGIVGSTFRRRDRELRVMNGLSFSASSKTSVRACLLTRCDDRAESRH